MIDRSSGLGPQFELPPSRCPYCDLEIARATAFLGDEPPETGSYTVCIGCAQPLIVADDMSLRKPKSGEFEQACKEDELFAAGINLMIKAVRSIDRRDIPS